MASAGIDRRRLNAPERTYAPIYRHPRPDAGVATSSSVPTTSSNIPPAPIILAGLIPSANGSAYYESQPPTTTSTSVQSVGPTSSRLKILASVYGPRQYNVQTASESSNTGAYADRAELNVDVRFACFAEGGRTDAYRVRGGGKRRRAGKDTESPLLSSLIRSILLPTLRLSALPKSSIDVFITILECDLGHLSSSSSQTDPSNPHRSGAQGDGGPTNNGGGAGGGPVNVLVEEESCAPACVTTASAALANAGIEMWGLCVGSYGLLTPTSDLLIAPSISSLSSYPSSSSPTSSLSLFTLPALGTIINLLQRGRSKNVKEVQGAMDQLVKVNEVIHAQVAKALVRCVGEANGGGAEGGREV